MNQHKAIAVFTEHYNATYYINFVSPFLRGQEWPHLQAISGEEIAALSPAELISMLDASTRKFGTGAAILSRYADARAEELLAYFRRREIPVFFHLDDWLFDVPADLGSVYTDRYDARYRDRLDTLLTQADGILCSTARLAQRVQQRFPGKPVHQLTGVCFDIFPRGTAHLKARLSRLKRRVLNRDKLTIGYAGSSSHARDLALVLPAIDRLLEERPQVQFHAFGIAVPEQLKRKWGNRISSFGYTRDYPSYLRTLYELGWDIGLSPLLDDEFNRCKTPTKLVEYASCGIPALCSDIEPYRAVFCQQAHAPLVKAEDWYAALHKWADNAEARQKGLCLARASLADLSAKAAAQALMRGLVLPGPPAGP